MRMSWNDNVLECAIKYVKGSAASQVESVDVIKQHSSLSLTAGITVLLIAGITVSLTTGITV